MAERAASAARDRQWPASERLVSRPEHLLRVASSVSQDASRTWSEIWPVLKRLSESGSEPAEAGGSAPPGGWEDFLEKFWLLKHYIDSIQRICNERG
jgi:hypothetical protein